MSERAQRPRAIWALILSGSALSLLVSFGLATMSIVVGSVEGRWVYEYVEGLHRRPLEIWLVAVVLSVGALVAVPLDSVRRHQWRSVLLWVALAFVIQGLMRSASPHRLDVMFASDGSNSFYTPTLQYSAGTILRDFERIRPTLPTHARSNMPGKLMIVYALEYVSTRPAILAWLVIAVSNAGGILFYLFVRDVLADRVAALVALMFYLFMPAKLFFYPILNTVTPTVFLTFACLWLRAMQTSRGAYAILAGVALYGLVCFEPLPLVMGVVCVALVAHWLWTGDLTARALLLKTSIIVTAFAATHAVMVVVWHFDLFAVFGQVAAEGVAFNAEVQRPYGIWVRQNLVDFFFGTGICQALLFIVAVGWAGVTWRAAVPGASLFLGIAAALVIVDLMGVNRAEVIRLWIFLACFVQIPAAFVCAKPGSWIAVALVLATTLLQDTVGTSMLNFGAP